MTRSSNRPKPHSQRASNVDELYPAVSEFVRTQGWIEIGDQEGFGFIVRALDYGGLVFETRKPRTLSEALNVLEKRIAKRADQ
jgi:hypothetical protein